MDLCCAVSNRTWSMSAFLTGTGLRTHFSGSGSRHFVSAVLYSPKPFQSRLTKGITFSLPDSLSHKQSSRSTISGENPSREKCSRITNGLPSAFQPGMIRSASLTPTSCALTASFPKVSADRKVNAIVRFLFPKIEQKQNIGSENEMETDGMQLQFWIREEGRPMFHRMRGVRRGLRRPRKATVYGC